MIVVESHRPAPVVERLRIQHPLSGNGARGQHVYSEGGKRFNRDSLKLGFQLVIFLGFLDERASEQGSRGVARRVRALRRATPGPTRGGGTTWRPGSSRTGVDRTEPAARTQRAGPREGGAAGPVGVTALTLRDSRAPSGDPGFRARGRRARGPPTSARSRCESRGPPGGGREPPQGS